MRPPAAKPRDPDEPVNTMLRPRMFVLPLFALIVIASLPRQAETVAPAVTACAATLASDAATRRHAAKPPCEPGRGQLALAGSSH